MGDWTLFSNHGHVLVCLARNNEARLRDVAADVGITERAVQKIVRELQQADYISITKHGRCNHYNINRRKALRHSLEAQVSVGRLLQLIVADGKAKPAEKEQKAAAPAAPDIQASKKTVPAAEKETAPAAEKESTRPAEKEKPPAPEKKEADKPKKEEAAPDDRQQGSLF